MTILVTGGNGQLGNEMRIIAGRSGEDRFIFTDVVDAQPESVEMLRKLAGNDVDISTTRLDITDLEAVRKMVRDNDVRVIVNCAAYTNVDGAESNREVAELLNAKAPENLAVAMKEVDGTLVHISTDYVFGKEPYNTPCREDQKGTPTGVYGLTKLHGEQNIMASGCKYVIIRTAWLYSEFGKNFVRTMLNLTATRPELKVVFDQVGTPTYAGDLAGAIIRVLEVLKHGTTALRNNGITEPWNYGRTESENCGKREERNFGKTELGKDRKTEFGNCGKTEWLGVFHFSNEGVCSWFDFTKMIAEYSGHLECNVQPCHSEEFPSPVKRPAFSVLDKTKIKNTLGISIPYWTDSLKKCIDNLLGN